MPRIWTDQQGTVKDQKKKTPPLQRHVMPPRMFRPRPQPAGLGITCHPLHRHGHQLPEWHNRQSAPPHLEQQHTSKKFVEIYSVWFVALDTACQRACCYCEAKIIEQMNIAVYVISGAQKQQFDIMSWTAVFSFYVGVVFFCDCSIWRRCTFVENNWSQTCFFQATMKTNLKHSALMKQSDVWWNKRRRNNLCHFWIMKLGGVQKLPSNERKWRAEVCKKKKEKKKALLYPLARLDKEYLPCLSSGRCCERNWRESSQGRHGTQVAGTGRKPHCSANQQEKV